MSDIPVSRIDPPDSEGNYLVRASHIEPWQECEVIEYGDMMMADIIDREYTIPRENFDLYLWADT